LPAFPDGCGEKLLRFLAGHDIPRFAELSDADAARIRHLITK